MSGYTLFRLYLVLSHSSTSKEDSAIRRISSVVSVITVLVFSVGMAYGQLANSPWPMVQHDARHTGRSQYEGPLYPVKKWAVETGGYNDRQPIIRKDGKILMPSDLFYCLNTDGSIAWAAGNGYSSAGVTDMEGRCYIESGNPSNFQLQLQCYDKDGWQLWTKYLYTQSIEFPMTPTMDAYGRVHVPGACYSSSGELLWSYAIVGESPGGYSSMTIANDGRLYYGSCSIGWPGFNNNFVCYHSNGSFAWSYLVLNEGYGIASISSKGTIYEISDKHLWAFNHSGTLAWSYSGGCSNAWKKIPAIGYDNRIYVLLSDGLFSFNDTGSLHWSYNLLYCSGYNPVVDSKGRIYIGAKCFDSTGSLLWTYALMEGSNILANDGTLYCHNGPQLVALTSGSAPPTPTPPPDNRQAEIILNSVGYNKGDLLQATFALYQPIERPFIVFSVVILPDGKTMLNIPNLSRRLKPLVTLNSLTAPLQYRLLSTLIPNNAPTGWYEIVVAFFDPYKPIKGRQDAFLDVNEHFRIF